MSGQNIISLDIQRVSNKILVLGIMSFFIHLLLYNYNISKENTPKSDYRSRHLISDIGTIINEPTVNTETEKNTLELINKPLDKLPLNRKPVQDITVLPKDKSSNIKKIGNMSIISISEKMSVLNILSTLDISRTKAEEINKIISERYGLSNFKTGNVVHIVNLSKNKSLNLKMTLVNKAEIFIKEKTGTYNVTINNISNKKVQIPPLSLKKQIITLSNDGIKKALVTQDIKRDLSIILQLLKEENILPRRIEVLYERKSSKDERLIYVDVIGYNSKIRVYKYIDRSGTTNYVKSNGTILTGRTTKPQTKKPSSNLKFSYPINNPVVESGFGMRRHPVFGKVKMHKGVDFRACRGTPIYAPADGVIIGMSNGRGFGKHVTLRHNTTYTTLYAHMDNFAYGKSPGMKVRRGEVIGYVGRTGITSGDHLHFEVHENGRPVNPMRMIGNFRVVNEKHEINQLSKKQMATFISYKDDVERRLKLL